MDGPTNGPMDGPTWVGARDTCVSQKNTDIQIYRNRGTHFFDNMKSPIKSGCFDTSRSPVAFFVAEIHFEIDFTILQCKSANN